MFLTPPMSDADWFAEVAARETMLNIAREQERKIVDFAAVRADRDRKKLRKARRSVPKIIPPR